MCNQIYFNMKYLFLIFKGFIIGVAKIIPGVSGAVMAISFGVYERLIKILSNPFKINKNDLKFLIFLLLGIAIGIALLCRLIKKCLDIYYLPTMLLFCGLIVGGMSEITNVLKRGKKKYINILIFIINFCLFFVLIKMPSLSIKINDIFLYFLMGIIESLTTIIPGISGTAIFMSLGWYEKLLTLYLNSMTFSVSPKTAILFLLGFICATILIARVITWLFEKAKEMAYCGVFGFMVSSLFVMFKSSFCNGFTIKELIIGIVLFIFGIYGSKKINKICTTSYD